MKPSDGPHFFSRANRGGARLAATFLAGLSVALISAPAQSQQLVHTFLDPAFGGNPFNYESLIGVANINRPAQPTTPVTTPTQEQLLASQLRTQLLSQLSGQIRDQIANARPGQSGQFALGDQQVSYAATTTATTVTFVDPRTGQTNTVVLPASGTTSASANAASISPEQALLGN